MRVGSLGARGIIAFAAIVRHPGHVAVGHFGGHFAAAPHASVASRLHH